MDRATTYLQHACTYGMSYLRFSENMETVIVDREAFKKQLIGPIFKK